MIYLIFACTLLHAGSHQGDCQAIPWGPYSTARACQADMRRDFHGLYLKGRLYTYTAAGPIKGIAPQDDRNWTGDWYECMRKPTWTPAQ